MVTDTSKFKSLADYLLGWTWDNRTSSNPIWASYHVKGPAIDRIDALGRATLRKDLVTAERIRLSDDFLLRSMETASTKEPSKMLSVAGLAKMPLDRPILVEFDANVVYRKRIELGTVPGPLEEEIVGRDGYLFLPDHNMDWSAIHVSDTPGGMPVWPAASALCPPMLDYLNTQQFCASAWGYVNPGGGLGFAIHQELMAIGRASVDPYFTIPIYETLLALKGEERSLHRLVFNAVEIAARENAGSLRHACAILAGLNAVPTTRVVRQPSGKFQHRLRNLPHLSITDVAIDARPGHTQAVYDKGFKTAIHHRLHDVRGHWRDFARHDAPFCDHEIVETDEVYALCGKCTRLLRWVVPHERGDEGLGRVIHDHYTVQ